MMLIKNGTVIVNADRVSKAHLVVADGRVKELLDDLPDSCSHFDRIIDADGKLVAPGLINGHTHSYANFYKTAVDKLPLEEMMFFIMAQGDCLQPEDVYYNTMLGAIEMIRGGITACLDQLSQSADGLEAAMSAYEQIGMRALVAPMIADLGYYDTLPLNLELIPPDERQARARSADELLAENLTFLNKWHGRHDRLTVGFGPSGPQRCSRELMRGAMAHAIDNDTVVHTHTLETRTQKNTAHLMFGMPMVEYLRSINCLNERLTMAHGVWITPPEAELAAAAGATVVHCPACNLYLGSGIAPVNLFRAVGLRVGLGTDGPNGGCNQSMLETMKLAGLLHRPAELDSTKWTASAEIFRMATEHNAAIIGMSGRLGTLEIGSRADIVIYDPVASVALQPLTDPVMQLALGETGAAVTTVIVQGEPVLVDGEFVTINEAALRQEIFAHAEVVRERLDSRRCSIEGQVAGLFDILPRDF